MKRILVILSVVLAAGCAGSTNEKTRIDIAGSNLKLDVNPRSIVELRGERSLAKFAALLNITVERMSECFSGTKTDEDLSKAHIEKYAAIGEYSSSRSWNMLTRSDRLFQVGKPELAIFLLNSAIDQLPPGLWFQNVIALGRLALYHYRLSDLVGLEKIVDRLVEYHRRTKQLSNPRWSNPDPVAIANRLARLDFYFYFGKALLAMSNHEFDNAVSNFDAALKHHALSDGLAGSENANISNIERFKALIALGASINKVGLADKMIPGGFNREPEYVPLTSSNLLFEVADFSELLYNLGEFREALLFSAIVIDFSKRSDCYTDINIAYRVARSAYAKSLAALGRWPRSIDAFENADKLSGPKLKGSLDSWYAISLVNAARAKDALEFLKVLQDRHLTGTRSNEVSEAELSGLRALAHFSAGDIRLARTNFAQSVPVIRSQFLNDQGKSVPQYRRLKWLRILASYVELEIEQLTKHKGDTRKAAEMNIFDISQIIRASGSRSQITKSLRRANFSDQKIRILVRDLDAEKRRRAIFRSLILTSTARRISKSTVDNFSKMAARTESRIAEIEKSIVARNPKLAETLSQPIIDETAVIRALRPDEAIVSALITHQNTIIWAANGSGEKQILSVGLGQSEISKLVDAIRLGVTFKSNRIEDIPKFNLKAAHMLYSRILAPVKGIWGKSKKLIFVPHGSLAQLQIGFLPIILLPTTPSQKSSSKFSEYRSVKWLLRKVAILNAPSIAAFVAARQRSKFEPPKKRFAGFGDPIFNKRKHQN